MIEFDKEVADNFFRNETQKILDDNLRELIRKEGYYEFLTSAKGDEFEFVRDSTLNWRVYINSKKVFDVTMDEDIDCHVFTINTKYYTLRKVKDKISKGLKDGTIKIT